MLILFGIWQLPSLYRVFGLRAGMQLAKGIFYLWAWIKSWHLGLWSDFFLLVHLHPLPDVWQRARVECNVAYYWTAAASLNFFRESIKKDGNYRVILDWNTAIVWTLIYIHISQLDWFFLLSSTFGSDNSGTSIASCKLGGKY